MIIISADTTLKGELRSKGRIKVDGRVEGEGQIDGILTLSRQSYWKGALAADIVIVEGTVDGDITAHSKLEIHSNATVNGAIISPTVTIRQGAKVTGRMRMRGANRLRLIDEEDQDAEAAKAEEPPRRIVGE